MSKTLDRVPEDWLRTTLRDDEAVLSAFVNESVNLYKGGDTDQGTFLKSMRLVLECMDAGPTGEQGDTDGD